MKNLMENSIPQISVIMGAYNCADTLPQTLDSLIGQTFKDFVCYICEDGSGDKTLDVIKEYAAKDSRFILLQNEHNMGLSHCLNKGINASTTKYIARMDGDDIAEPDRFEKQFNFLEQNQDIDFCGGAIRYFDSNGFWGNHIYPERPEPKDYLFTSPFCHPTVMYRKDSLLKMKGSDGTFYSESKKIGRSEDYDLFMRMQAAGLKAYNFQDYLLQYREDANAFAKRKFKYAIIEARVRYRGFKALKLLPKGFIYVIKPVIVSLVPKTIRRALHKKQYKAD